ncbi:hypothetical protein KBI31_01540 [Patescibacteria group bacterium]|mgnify:CR=1 FL=1|jgi:hypothetical protein|nr:hypothetical protein [Patescibacteria group bacterium]HPD07971.1 hypothetical protein [bacterium]HRT11160.1 hypothetical protein [Patescibacteria group bacterium]
MLHFLGGLAIVVLGAVIILKREWILNNFGRIDFFEEKLSAYGGTRMAYSLIGLIAIFIGFCIAFGLINNFLGWMLGPLLRYQQS